MEVFNHVKVKIVAKSIEFRRSIILEFVSKIEQVEGKAGGDGKKSS